MQVNAKDHGATGSGVEDETPSFHAALAALPPCGGTLFVPEGTYVIGDLTIGKSIVVQGIGPGAGRRTSSCRRHPPEARTGVRIPSAPPKSQVRVTVRIVSV
jgi:polygalacturonase